MKSLILYDFICLNYRTETSNWSNLVKTSKLSSFSAFDTSLLKIPALKPGLAEYVLTVVGTRVEMLVVLCCISTGCVNT